MKDLIILGNGMAGMTAALYAKRANLDFKIVSRDEYAFGQIGSAVLVENYPCINKTTGYNLAERLHDQLEENKIDIEEKEIITLGSYIGDHGADNNWNHPYYIIEYEDGTIDYAKTVIYTLGAKHRELNCEIEEGIPIHHCALCDGALYKDKTVAIIGGGDAAFTQAEYLSKICKEVLIVMCDENITASPSTVERVKKVSNIHIEYNFPIVVIKKINYSIGLFSEEPGSTLSSWYGPRVDGVFVAIGMIPNTEQIDIGGIKDDNGYIIADESCASLAPGFFAAGDCRTKAVRQAITAAADGTNAVDSVIKYLKENR